MLHYLHTVYFLLPWDKNAWHSTIATLQGQKDVLPAGIEPASVACEATVLTAIRWKLQLKNS